MVDYLYHYTSIDTLALILKNRTIRFNSLCNVNDKQEQMSEDNQNFGKLIFVSCWTHKEDEEIPMWKMYSEDKKGVRIKLPKNPFKQYEVDYNKIKDIFPGKLSFDLEKSIIPTEIIYDNKYTVQPMNMDPLITYMEYDISVTDSLGKILKVDDNFNIDLKKLGKHKNEYWDFEKEVRYRLVIYPISFKHNMSEYYIELSKFQESVKLGTASLPFEYFDLAIDDNCFKDMEIMLSPNISESSEIFADLLVERFNPDAKIVYSKLRNLIK